MTPRATYRLQMNAQFTFADAAQVVPYLADLGISHVYASPIATARSGSSHGYDAVDPSIVNPALGGEDGLRDFVATLREHDLGLIIDIVPNHMAASPENPWWAHVLRYGRDSRYARYFEIDWSRHGGRILLPVLGEPLNEALAAGNIQLADHDGELAVSLYGEHFYPLDPETAPSLSDHEDFNSADPVGRGLLKSILEKQHYLLTWWRNGHDELNWRRFFSISELAGLRVEDEDVFDAVHALPLRLYEEGLIDGLRIDHVDGLAYPQSYLERLRSRLDRIDQNTEGRRAWVVVEKILGPEETLPEGWPVDGTTGYDFMDDVSQLLHAAEGEAPLTRNWANLSSRSPHFADEERRARRELLHWEFTSQFERCVDAAFAYAKTIPEASRYTRAAWWRAIEALLQIFPVYRTYGTGNEAPARDAEVRGSVADKLYEVAPPGEDGLGRQILCWLAGECDDKPEGREFVRQFQQLSAPIAAKAVEDTAFYRYGRLLSRNDVGFDAARFHMDVAEFHQRQRSRAEDWPASQLTTATHDHKRGEDVRARLAVISEVPGAWVQRSQDWMTRLGKAGETIDAGDLYMLLQMLVGAWPHKAKADDPASLRGFAERMKGWQVKALREGKLRSSWVQPNEDYEARLTGLIDEILTGSGHPEVREDIAAFVAEIGPAFRLKSLTQLFLRYTCPGVPDLYQGTELRDFTLVDPDNRRPVDFDKRAKMLAAGKDEKLTLIRDLLDVRRRFPAAFAGDYAPVRTEGGAPLIAFTRGQGDAGLLFVAQMALGETAGRFGADAELWRGTTLRREGVTNEVDFDRLINEGGSLLRPALPVAVWPLSEVGGG